MSNKKEVIQEIIHLLSSLIEDEPEAEAVEETKQKQKRNTGTRKKKATTSGRENKFETMDIRKMHKDDVKIDRLLSKQPPCPRTRTHTTIDVCCRSCGKRESVSPILVSEKSRYKCNTCATSEG
jgi:hypothetical protein